jgi:hypothetical protein
VEIVAVTPSPDADLWLHDRIKVTFSEAVDLPAGRVWLMTDDGTVLASSGNDWMADERVSLQVGAALSYSGAVHLLVDEPPDEPTAEWTLPPWTVDGAGLDFGEAPTAPAVVWNNHYGAVEAPYIAVVWVEGPATARRITGVIRVDGRWEPMGSLEGVPDGDPELAIDGFGGCIIATLGDSGALAQWCREWSELEWSIPVPASLASGDRRVVVAGGRGAITVTRVELEFVGEEPEWEMTFPATEIVVKPAVTLRDGEWPVVAFIDRVDATQGQLHVFRYINHEWEDLGMLSVTPGNDAPSVAVIDEHVYVSWTDASMLAPRVQVADVTSEGWQVLTPPGEPEAATHGAELVASRLGLLESSWIEDGTISAGNVGRWTGTGWVTVSSFAQGDLGGETAPLDAAFRLADGAAPITAWRDGTGLHVGLFNGEPGTLAKP